MRSRLKSNSRAEERKSKRSPLQLGRHPPAKASEQQKFAAVAKLTRVISSVKAESFELEGCSPCQRGFTGIGNSDQSAVSGMQREDVLAQRQQRYRWVQ